GRGRRGPAPGRAEGGRDRRRRALRHRARRPPALRAARRLELLSRIPAPEPGLLLLRLGVRPGDALAAPLRAGAERAGPRARGRAYVEEGRPREVHVVRRPAAPEPRRRDDRREA